MQRSWRQIWLSAAALALLFSSAASAADLTPVFQPLSLPSVSHSPMDAKGMHEWKMSLGPVIASQALDVTSSLGMRELNPLLAGSDGHFGARGAGIKLGATAGILGIEYFIAKRHPRAARVLSKINWAASIMTAGFAAHNFALR